MNKRFNFDNLFLFNSNYGGNCTLKTQRYIPHNWLDNSLKCIPSLNGVNVTLNHKNMNCNLFCLLYNLST